MSRQGQIFNFRGLWSRIKTKMIEADTATLNAAKAYALSLINDSESSRFELVQSFASLPTGNDIQPKTIYFVPAAVSDENPNKNFYDEYVWIASKNSGAGGWEKVGTTDYKPERYIVNDDTLEKLKITIDGEDYVVPRVKVIKPATPQLKDGNTVVADGDDFTNTKSLALACATEGAEIRYIIGENGLEPIAPTASSTKYTSAISFAQDTAQEYKEYRIKATAFLNGAVSDVLDITIKIYRQVAKPTFGVAAGTYGATQSVSLSCTTADATIRFAKSEGSTPADPTASSDAYESAISVTKSTTIKAYASKANWRDSAVATASYTLQVGTPTVSAAGDQYDTSRVVTISKPANADSYKYKKTGDSGYTTGTGDGTTITLNSTATVEVIAERDGWSQGSKTLAVTVGTLYTHAGLSAASAASNVSLAELTVLDSGNTKKPNPAGNYSFSNNSGAAKYIWFAVPSDKTISSVMVGATPQDVEAPQTVGNYKFYRMTGALVNGESITLTVA